MTKVPSSVELTRAVFPVRSLRESDLLSLRLSEMSYPKLRARSELPVKRPALLSEMLCYAVWAHTSCTGSSGSDPDQSWT